MKKLDVIVLTRQLNQLRMRNPELKISEFREEISKFVSYNMFSSLLLEEGYAHSINGIVRFSPNPIHKSKVEIILTEAREYQNKYTKQYLERRKELKRELKEERDEVKKAISLLISKGFVIKTQDIL